MSEEGEFESVEITKSIPSAEASQIPAVAPATVAKAADAVPTLTPHPSPKRKKSPSSRSSRGGGEDDGDDDDDEMDGEGGDPSTLAHEVQLRKIHQTLKKFSSRLTHNEEQIEGQGRVTDEVSAKRRMDEQEKISRTYEIMGTPDQATTPTTHLNWLIHDPEQADNPKHEICSDDCKWSKPKDGKQNFIVVFRASASKSKIDAYMTKRTNLIYWDSTTNRMWSNAKIYGRWTETLLQRDKIELLNVAWQSIKECFGIDAVFDNSAGLLLDHRCSCIRYKQAKKPMLVITVAENAGDPRARIFPSTVNPYSFKQMEDMIGELMKKGCEARIKSQTTGLQESSRNPSSFQSSRTAM